MATLEHAYHKWRKANPNADPDLVDALAAEVEYTVSDSMTAEVWAAFQQVVADADEPGDAFDSEACHCDDCECECCDEDGCYDDPDEDEAN